MRGPMQCPAGVLFKVFVTTGQSFRSRATSSQSSSSHLTMTRSDDRSDQVKRRHRLRPCSMIPDALSPFGIGPFADYVTVAESCLELQCGIKAGEATRGNSVLMLR